MTPLLWSLSYSPYSDRARWALDHCEVPYRRRAYQPLLEEPQLRLKLRRAFGPVSVPILETDEGVVDGSFDIARYADLHAARAELRILLPEQLDAIRRYDRLGSDALSAGREVGLRQVLEDDEALAELVPPTLRKALGRVSIAIARAGVKRTLAKYAADTPAEPERALVEIAQTLRADLEAARSETNDTPYLLGAFSYADIVMAEALAFIEPPPSHLRLGEGSRRAYHRPEVAGRFRDLMAWRDALYARRKSPVRA